MLNKQDKQFRIMFDQSNRDFLSNMVIFQLGYQTFLISLILSFTAIIIAVYGINLYSMGAVVFLGMAIIIIIFLVSNRIKKTVIGVKNLNRQLQKELIELYPDYEARFR